MLSAEAVTEDHPGQDWFRSRYSELRRLVVEALSEVCADDDPPDPADFSSAASSVLAVIDGLQIQWLLDRDAVDLAQATAFGIDAILASAIAGKRRRSAL